MSSRTRQLRALTLAGATLLLKVAAATCEPLPWLEARPSDPAEAALEAARNDTAHKPLVEQLATFEEVAQRFAGTPAAGLAHLAAGLRLLRAERPHEALPHLAHRDTRLTVVVDHALLGLGRAQARLQQPAAAAAALIEAANLAGTPLICPALLEAADALAALEHYPEARSALTRARLACPREAPRALARLGEINEAAGDRKQAALAYDELDRLFPASAEARAAARRLAALQSLLPGEPARARTARELDKAMALVDAGEARAALPVLQRLARYELPAEQTHLVRTRLGQTLAKLRRVHEARRTLEAVPADSPYAGEAAYHAARLLPERARLASLEAVVQRFSGSVWAEQALFDLGNHHQKDQRVDVALAYYQRLLQSYPDGRHAERATWYAGLAELRAGRPDAAAQAFERAARLRATSGYAPAFLYWAGRARQQLHQTDRAQRLLGEVLHRYRYTYYGERALEALGPGAAQAVANLARIPKAGSPVRYDLPQPQRSRVWQLMLAGLDEEALGELRTLAPSRSVEATRAFLEHRRGRLRDAIAAMRRAFPDYTSAAAAELPQPVWEILYPLLYGSTLQARASAQGLDPALVAALVCQESSFEAEAVSAAGARGLMQVMPATGRTLARRLGLRRFRTSQLNDPETSLTFGTLYLRQMLDRFDGRVERALAAYNAGPHRVEAWTAGRPSLGSEEFIESIPFTETRTYVKLVLGAREQYRRVYGLPTAAPATPTTGQ